MNKIRLSVVLFIFFAGLYSFFSIGHFGGDGYEDYLAAESIALDRNLELYDRPEDPDQLDYGTGWGIKGRGGNIYSSRGLGIPLLLALFYSAGHLAWMVFGNLPHDFVTMLFASFYNPLISALNVLLVFIISCRLRFRVTTAFILSVIYAMATMAPAYVRTGFAEPTIIMFLLLGINSAILYSQYLRCRYLVYSALALSYCALIKIAGFIYIPCILFYLALVSWKRNKNLPQRLYPIAIFTSTIILSSLLIFGYNHFITGNALHFGAYHSVYGAKRILESPHFLKGLYYYLLSTGKGFLLFNLPVILSFVALFRISKERRRETLLFVLIFAINLLFFVKSFRRGSLFSWGPRYLLPSVPVLVFLIGDYIENYRRLISRLALWFLSLAGFFIMLPCMFIKQSQFYFFVKNELRLDEYMINFIPDLSPIMASWRFFLSRIILNISGKDIPFVYMPDYKLVPAVTASMKGYNSFDFWFLKIIDYAPEYKGYCFILMGIMGLVVSAGLVIIAKCFFKRRTA